MKYFFLLPGMLFLLSCGTNFTDVASEDSVAKAAAPCSEDLMCTEVFVQLTTKVIDQEGALVLLDSYISKNSETGAEYDLQGEASGEAGIYPLISDAQLKELKKEGSPIEFIGRKNGEVVVQEVFQLGHDCCHVLNISGPDTIQINL